MKKNKKFKIGILVLFLSISLSINNSIIFADYESAPIDDANNNTDELDEETSDVTIPNEETTLEAIDEEETQEEGTEEEEPQMEESDGGINNTEEISPRLSNVVAHVTTETELLAEVNDIANTPGPTKTIIIDNDIVLTDEITMNMSHGKNVIIKGDNKLVTLTTAVNKKHVVLSGTAATTLSFENIEFKGLIEDSRIVNGAMDIIDVKNAPNGGGVAGVYGSGVINFKNVNFVRNKSEHVSLYSSSTTFKVDASKATFDNVNFISNFSNDGGAAIRMDEGNMEISISNSSFIDNAAVGTEGVVSAGGALHSSGGTAPITITNSVFEQNQLYNEIISDGGGAIAVSGGLRPLSIDSSVFDGNKTLLLNGTGYTGSDGGAVFLINSEGKMEITNSTFTNNSSLDEGGAISNIQILMPIRSVIKSSTAGNRIANCTFVGNTAGGKGNGIGGGAIHLDGFRAPTQRMRMTLENNTIYGNNAVPSGGGISFDGATVTATNNIITGNSVEPATDTAKNVYVGANATLEGNNNVIDGSVSDTFGFDNPALLNFVGKLVGSTTNLRAIKTLPIKPEGLADDKATATVNADQNGNPRDPGTNLADIGAFEMKWVKYVANKSNSNWTLPALLNNDGKTYYSTANPNIIYLMYPYQTLSHATKEKPIEPNPWRFTSWNTSQDGSGKNYNEATGIELLTDKNHTLYGRWQSINVMYDLNTGTGIVPVDDNVYVKNETVTVLGHSTISKAGYTFVGWNTKADGSGKTYQEGETFVITNDTVFVITTDTVLYAQWKKTPKVVPANKNIPVGTGDEIDMNILLLSSIMLLAAIIGILLRKSFKRV